MGARAAGMQGALGAALTVALCACGAGKSPAFEAAIDAAPPPPAVDAAPPLPVFSTPSPPMGWNTWNHFECNIDEALIRETADALVASGLKDAGYEYVVIDDCWARSRDAAGTILPDPVAFPSGIPALADYVHADGLKLGIYTAAGDLTCKSRPGSYGHEAQDARTFADWGVDFIKEDWCSARLQNLDAKAQYGIFRRAIDGAGRDMVFSVCTAGADWPVEWAPALSSMWRTTPDIALHPTFAGMLANFYGSAEDAAVATYGHTNDPDILEVGNGRMTESEERAHFSLWAISAAPLMLGNDVRSMPDSTLAILANREVIAIDQDVAGVQATLVQSGRGVQVWSRPLTEPGARAVVVLNTTEVPAPAQVSWPSLGLQEGAAKVEDVWAHTNLGELGAYRVTVAPHDVAMLVVHGRDAVVPSGGVWDLGGLAWTYAASGQGTVARDEVSGGGTMQIAGASYGKGIGVHAESVVSLRLDGGCRTFSAIVGVDDSFGGLLHFGAGSEGTVTFEVWTDGDEKVATGVMTNASTSRRIEVDVRRAQTLRLVVTGAGDSTTGDVADWADATLDCR